MFTAMGPVKNKLAKNCPMHSLSGWAIIDLFTSNEIEGM